MKIQLDLNGKGLPLEVSALPRVGDTVTTIGSDQHSQGVVYAVEWPLRLISTQGPTRFDDPIVRVKPA